MKAVLRLHEKFQLSNRFLIEMAIFEINDKKQYPDGVKYRLVCLDMTSLEKVLMDNHYPKGHHIHIDDKELKYDFISYEKLIADFKMLIKQNLGAEV